MAGSLDTLLAELFGEDSETENLPNKIKECQMIPICYPSGLHFQKFVFNEVEQVPVVVPAYSLKEECVNITACCLIQQGLSVAS